MDFALFSSNGLMFVLRWLHFIFGVTWIGLLYYFNFVQGAFFAETDASTKSGAIQKLVPRALWWFRWSAMFTFVGGLIFFVGRTHQVGGMELSLHTSWGIMILSGIILATIMWANVWFVIWPNQKIVIQSATQVASGGAALPQAAAAGARAGLASRHNVLFSFPMLFFMGAASHLPIQMGPGSPVGMWFGVFGAIALLLEANALKGKMGPLSSIAGVIHCSLALSLAFYFLMEVIL